MTKEVRSLEHENITSSCCVCVWLGVGGLMKEVAIGLLTYYTENKMIKIL